MIIFSDVSFGYDPGDRVLDTVNLKLHPGLTLILGPNGAGKSTFLKLAAGVEHPDSGRITVDGHDLWTEEVAARKGLAYLPEFADVTPYASLRDVIALVCRLRGEPVNHGVRILESFGLASQSGKSIRELSSGERKRTLLAAAMIGHPDHLLLDEPLDALDRKTKDSTTAWLKTRAGEGAVVAVISHELEPFAEIASHAVSFREGQIVLYSPLPETGPNRMDLLERMARGLGPAKSRPRP